MLIASQMCDKVKFMAIKNLRLRKFEFSEMGKKKFLSLSKLSCARGEWRFKFRDFLKNTTQWNVNKNNRKTRKSNNEQRDETSEREEATR